MALSKIDAANFLTGTIPSTNVANASLSSVTALPAGVGGKVLQVVYSENAYQHSTTSATYTDILSASATTWETTITPSATSSKIIILGNLLLTWEQNGNANNRGEVQVLNKVGAGGYSALQQGTGGNYDYGASGVQSRQRWQIQYLISPSTTSVVTVKFQFNTSGGATCNFNDGSNYDSSCILYEVAG